MPEDLSDHMTDCYVYLNAVPSRKENPNKQVS
jgi:hypothetical protein